MCVFYNGQWKLGWSHAQCVGALVAMVILSNEVTHHKCVHVAVLTNTSSPVLHKQLYSLQHKLFVHILVKLPSNVQVYNIAREEV